MNGTPEHRNRVIVLAAKENLQRESAIGPFILISTGSQGCPPPHEQCAFNVVSDQCCQDSMKGKVKSMGVGSNSVSTLVLVDATGVSAAGSGLAPTSSPLM